MSCDSEVKVVNEHALKFSILGKPVPLMEYIKTISSLIGASHIVAVFEETESIKFFFDDKKFADTLFESGIHVLGHHISVDYVVPPGTKVILSNIYPTISNFDLMRRLSIYGTVVSPVIRTPISNDTEFCHIDFGVRYVYMILHGPMPSTFVLKHGDQLSTIKIKTEDAPVTSFIKTENCDNSDADTMAIRNAIHDPDIISDSSVVNVSDCTVPSYLDDNSNPVVVSVQSIQSAPLEANSVVHNDSSEPSSVEKLPVKRRGRLTKSLHMKRSKITPASRAANRIKQNVKHKWIHGRKRKYFKKGKRGPGRPPKQKVILSPPSSPCSSSDSDNSNPVVVSVQSMQSVENAPLEANSVEQNDSAEPSSVEKLPVKRRGRLPKSLHMKRSKITLASRAANRIKQNVKHKWIQGRKRKYFKKEKRGPGRPPKQKVILSPPASSYSSSDSDNSSPPSLTKENDYVLSKDEMKKFVHEVKHCRSPVELAKKYIGNKCSDEKLGSLICQLNRFKASSAAQRQRLNRLSRVLKDSLEVD